MGRRKRKEAEPPADETERHYRESQRMHPNQLAGPGHIVLPQKKFYRQRAHVNPFSDHNVVYPPSPSQMDWHFHFPGRITTSSGRSVMKQSPPQVEIADIGCGFGGLIFCLAPHFPDKLIVGMEIRTSVTQYVYDKVQALRLASRQPTTLETGGTRATSAGATSSVKKIKTGENEELASNAQTSAGMMNNSNGVDAIEDANEKDVNSALVNDAPNVPGGYDNISAMRVNAMKHLPNFFRRGQLTKLFFLHPDPHFKQRKSKNRIISPTLLAEYAYVLRPDGILYTITDVHDLHRWMVKHLTAFPLFERIPDDDDALKADICVDAVWNSTEEGKKVVRNHGEKWFAAFRRIRDQEEEEQIE